MNSSDWKPLRRIAPPTVEAGKRPGSVKATVQLNAKYPGQWKDHLLEWGRINGVGITADVWVLQDKIELLTTADDLEREILDLDRAIENANSNFESVHLDVIRATEERAARASQDAADSLHRAQDIASRIAPPAE